jgi:hypothetical protein
MRESAVNERSTCGMTGCLLGGMMSGMQRFVDDDRGHLEWLAHHPGGFVINTGRTPTAVLAA